MEHYTTSFRPREILPNYQSALLPKFQERNRDSATYGRGGLRARSARLENLGQIH